MKNSLSCMGIFLGVLAIGFSIVAQELPVRLMDWPGTIEYSGAGGGTGVGQTFYMYFGGSGDYRLWKTNGTVAGTGAIPLPPGAAAVAILDAGDTLLYYISYDVTYTETHLWRTDGTEAGVVDLGEYDTDMIDEHRFALEGNTLYFSGIGTLWKTDGSVAGTTQIASFSEPYRTIGATGKLFYSPAFITKVKNGIVFGAYSDQYGYELWLSDGTSAGTTAMDLNPITPEYSMFNENEFHSCPWDIQSAGDYAFFIIDSYIANFMNSGPSGGYRSDGTVAGLAETGVNFVFRPQEVGDLIFLPSNGRIDAMPASGGPVFRVKDLPLSIYGNKSFPLSPLGCGNRLFFACENDDEGSELWVSDGTESGTHEVVDLLPGSESGALGGSRVLNSPSLMTSVGNNVYFYGYTPQTGYELMKSDGTVEGTVVVADINPGPANGVGVEFGSSPRVSFPPTLFNGYLYFCADDGVHDYGIYAISMDDNSVPACANNHGGVYGAGQEFCIAVPAPVPAGAEFQWFCNGVPLVDDYRISGVSTRTLSIDGLVETDTGNYTCVYGSETFGPISLTVSEHVPVTGIFGQIALGLSLIGMGYVIRRRLFAAQV